MKLTYTETIGQVTSACEIEGDCEECIRVARALNITPAVDFELDPTVEQTPATGGIVPPGPVVYYGDSALTEAIPFTRGEDGSITIQVHAPSVSGVVGESDEGIDLSHKIKQVILKEKRPGGILA